MNERMCKKDERKRKTKRKNHTSSGASRQNLFFFFFFLLKRSNLDGDPEGALILMFQHTVFITSERSVTPVPDLLDPEPALSDEHQDLIEAEFEASRSTDGLELFVVDVDVEVTLIVALGSAVVIFKVPEQRAKVYPHAASGQEVVYGL